MITALKKAGFPAVDEAAEGADETKLHESAEWAENMEKGECFMTTSCCPAYIETGEKHLPDIGTFVSGTASPMAYTASKVRKTDPEAAAPALQNAWRP